MKKIMITLGIAFALICGALFGAAVTANHSIVEEPEEVSIEEAVADYLTYDGWYEVDSETVEVLEIAKDNNYGGGYAVSVHFEDPNTGHDMYSKIAISSLDC